MSWMSVQWDWPKYDGISRLWGLAAGGSTLYAEVKGCFREIPSGYYVLSSQWIEINLSKCLVLGGKKFFIGCKKHQTRFNPGFLEVPQIERGIGRPMSAIGYLIDY
ncbi:hypothetical protein PV328_006493 [Microctonus aethiopoides]|uniref:Uncharacterized protein n=1 Tax=Microctonus aethiopoides TaxID=144406 RepID=A0AA39FPM0_9HYME|nr:hypothetical protein PV328_006493 [Microctonus aethiopoides]